MVVFFLVLLPVRTPSRSQPARSLQRVSTISTLFDDLMATPTSIPPGMTLFEFLYEHEEYSMGMSINSSRSIYESIEYIHSLVTVAITFAVAFGIIIWD